MHDRAVRSLTEGEHEVQGFTTTRDGRGALLRPRRRASAIIQSDISISPGHFSSSPALNDGLMASLDIAAPEMFWTRSFDGTRIQGWVLKPPGFDPSRQ